MDERKEVIKQLVTFCSITITISIGIYIWMFLTPKNNMTAIFLMMFTPGISAIITSLILKDKISSYGWKPGKIKFLGYAYIFPFLVSVVAYGIPWLLGLTEFTTKVVENYNWSQKLGFELPTPFIVGVFSKMTLGFIFTCLPVFGEELGWSGFFTPKLLKIYSAPLTSIIVGLFWALWHFPAIIGGIYGQGTPLWIALPGFTLVLVGYSFVRTALISKSHSLWTGVVLHASGNTILMGMFWSMTAQKGYAAYIVSETGILTGIICILFAMLFWRMQMNFSYENNEINQPA